MVSRIEQCSGEHPSCKRCISRSLVCEYAKEGRVRGPNKPKAKTSLLPSEDQQFMGIARNRSSSANTSSSAGSSDYFDVRHMLTSLQEPRPSVSQHGALRLLQAHRPSLSLDEHRANRPRPPNLDLESTPQHYRLTSSPQTLPTSYSPMDEISQYYMPIPTPCSFPQGSHSLSEQGGFDHNQSGPSSSTTQRDDQQSQSEFLLTQTQFPAEPDTQDVQTQHDSSPLSIMFDTKPSYTQYDRYPLHPQTALTSHSSVGTRCRWRRQVLFTPGTAADTRGRGPL